MLWHGQLKKKKRLQYFLLIHSFIFFFNDVEFHLYSFAGEIQIQLSHHHLLQILQNVTKITFHNWTVSTSLFNKNWSYSVKQDKQVLHSFAFWGSSTPPPANTHTHTHTYTRARLKILNVKFQKQFIFCTILNCMMNHPTLFCPGCKSFLCPAYPTH